MSLYTAQTNSPSTTLASAAAANATTLSLANGSVFSGLALPNLLTLGYTQANSETVLVTAISGDTATVERGVDGTATDWAVDTPVARVFTAKDWNDMITEKADATSVPSATTTSPKMDGTAAVGSETAWAKGDHVHPTDTSRQAKITASGILKGDGNGGVSAAVSGTDYQAPLTAGTDYISPPSSPSSGNVLTYNGSAWAASAPSYVPSQSGYSGKFLTTNGSAASWANVATVYTGTFLSSGWSTSSGYKTQTISISGLKSSYDIPPQADCVLAGNDASGDSAILEGFGCISILTTGTNQLTAKCAGDAPTVNVPVKVVVFA